MIIEEEVYFSQLRDNEIEDFLNHHGVKGMKWGIRNDLKKIGRGTWRATKAVGRGTVKVARWSKAHPKTTATIAAGAAFATALLIRRGRQKYIAASAARASKAAADQHWARVIQTGFSFRQENGPWNYSLPTIAHPEDLRFISSHPADFRALRQHPPGMVFRSLQ